MVAAIAARSSPISASRVTELIASLVWSVASTRRPVIAAPVTRENGSKKFPQLL